MKLFSLRLFAILCVVQLASAHGKDLPLKEEKKTQSTSFTLTELDGQPSAKGNRPITSREQSWLQKSKSSFEENKGQISGEDAAKVNFRYQSGDVTVFLMQGGLAYQFEKHEHIKDDDSENKAALFTKRALMYPNEEANGKFRTETYRMDIVLKDANLNAKIITEGKSKTYNNYYSEEIFTTANYDKVTYKDIYPNIDWVVYTNGSGLKYDFVVRPGGNPADIKLVPRWTEQQSIQKDGSLLLKNRMGNIIEHAPLSYQGTEIVNSSFEQRESYIGFAIDNYDKTAVLIIDPSVVWASYYGGSGIEGGKSCATDRNGNVFLAGTTKSGSNIAAGGHDLTYGGNYDAFLVKFDQDGNRHWSTYYGGSEEEQGYSCATDALGNVYLAGTTKSTTGISSGGFQNTYGGSMSDAFLVKFSPNGNRIWATYYGGTAFEEGFSCATDDLGNVFLVGATNSSNNIAFDGFKNTNGGGVYDGFIVKFNSSGGRQWGTYFGAENMDMATFCATDAAGNLFVTGTTQLVYGSVTYEAFLLKCNTAGQPQWLRHLDENNTSTLDDIGLSCATDLAGNIYMAGHTQSTSGINYGGFQSSFGGGVKDAFLAKYSSNGTKQWSTYYGGSGDDIGNSCATDAAGNVYLSGFTTSTTGIASGGVQDTYGGTRDAFIVKFSSTSQRVWASYYGGSADETGGQCTTDFAGNIYFAGDTKSTTGIASGGFQNSLGGNSDAFLVKIKDCTPYSVLYVDSSISAPGDGSSWTKAYKYLNNALETARQCSNVDSILVAKGTYYPVGSQLKAMPTIPLRDMAFIMPQTGGLKIYGGFNPGGQGGWAARTMSIGGGGGSILSGDISSTVGDEYNSYHVMIVAGIAANADSVIIDGFAIIKGNANDGFAGTSITINSTTISRGNGGGIYTRENQNVGKISLRNCVLSKNHAGNGGGIHNLLSSPSILNCNFSGNTAQTFGAGLDNNQSAPLIVNSIFSGNLSNNIAGAGIKNHMSSPSIINCVFSGNKSPYDGAAIYNESSSNPTISNTIIYGNSSGISNDLTTSANATYSLVQDYTTATNGNISGSTNPLFTNAPAANSAPFTNGNYQLLPCSPSINAGKNASVPSYITKDIGNNNRIFDAKVDMGVFEYQSIRSFTGTNMQNICQGQSYNFNGIVYTTSNNTAKDTLQSVYGCDSIVTLNLTVSENGIATANTTASNIQHNNNAVITTLDCKLIAKVNNASNLGNISISVKVNTSIPSNSDPFVSRYFDISAANNLGGLVTLYFTQAEIAAYNALVGLNNPSYPQIGASGQNMQITAFHSLAGSGSGTGPLSYDQNTAEVLPCTGVWNAAKNRWEVSFTTTSFSGFFLHTTTNGAPLPITLANIKATNKGDYNEVSWHTAKEATGDLFEIERSKDGRIFNKIGDALAIGESGSQYNFNDNDPYVGINFYRLYLNNISGSNYYSKVVMANMQKPKSMALAAHPNPFNEVVTIVIGDKISANASLIVTNASGIELKRVSVNNQRMDLSLKGLASGIYFVTFIDGSRREMIKLIKE